MTVLLDTHVWLWMLTAPARLGAAREVLADPRTELLLSAASTWEIAIKCAAGRLALPQPPEDYVPERMRTTGVTALPVDHRHTLAVAGLPLHHRDPFDRLLIAQARQLEVPLATSDARFTAYEVQLLDIG